MSYSIVNGYVRRAKKTLRVRLTEAGVERYAEHMNEVNKNLPPAVGKHHLVPRLQEDGSMEVIAENFLPNFVAGQHYEIARKRPKRRGRQATATARADTGQTEVLPVPVDDGRAAYSVSEAAGKLGLERKTVYSAIKRGQIPHILVGSRILVPKSYFRKLSGEP